MTRDRANHPEKQGLRRISSASEFTVSDVAGTHPDLAYTNTNTRSFQMNKANHTPAFAYLHVSSTLFPSSSPLSLFPVHNSTIIAEHKVRSSFSISPCHVNQLTPSTSICGVQHSLSTAYTLDSLSSFHSHEYELTPECSGSFWCASLHDWLPSATMPWELKGEVTF